jgi:hypothetical protein
MNCRLASLSLSFLSVLLAPALAQSAAISANGTCVFGNCSSPGTLSSTDTVSGTQNFTYTFGNGDTYNVTTTYSADDTINMNFSVNGAYVGNNGNSKAPSAGNDTLKIDFLQNFAYTGSSSADATASATLMEEGNAPGSYSEAQLFFDGQGVGLMGPYYGQGTESVSSGPTTISNLGNPIDGDFNFTLFFAAGTTAAPEPASARLILLVGILFAFPALRYTLRKARAQA